MKKSNLKTLSHHLLVSSFFIFNLFFIVRGQHNFASEVNNEPYFIEEPYDIRIKENSRTVLPCKIAGLDRQVIDGGGAHIQWTKDGFGLGTGRQLDDWPHFRMVGANLETDWDLEIDPVSVDDDDIYQCQVTLGYTDSLRSKKAKVEVLVPPQDPFIKEGPILNVKESRDVAITCIAKGGKPAAKLTWYDGANNLINDVSSYHTKKMEGKKLFEATSTIVITPTRDHHNTTFRCEATNEADNLSRDGEILKLHSGRIRPAAEARVFVQYAPSVSVQPIRPGMVQEGNKAAFRCDAEANPPPYPNSYKWYIDDKEIPGQFRQYFEIYNVTRSHHDKQIKCSVENELGTAMGLRSIQVKYGPTMTIYPITTAGDKMNAVMLFCLVDSNPPPKYHWTKGNSREVISNRQNLTVPVSEGSIGTYYCHAEVSGYKTITSRPGADVLMTGPPKITSSPTQSGIVGENVHINCAAITVPEPDEIIWMYHESKINEGNSHYRIINSAIQHGIRSTLVIRESLGTDYGPYTCLIKNSHGTSEIQIQLEQQRPFPLQMTLIAIFGGVILILLLSIVCILFRKRLCCCCFDPKKESKMNKNNVLSNNGRGDADAKNLRKVNNIVDQLSNNTTHLKQELTPSMSHENDSTCWRGSEMENDGGFNNGTICRSSTVGVGGSKAMGQICGPAELTLVNPDFQPQPDVINGGYISYGHVMDYNPPQGSQANRNTIYECNGSQNIITSPGSALNVSDPRYSATYGNPYLKQLPDQPPQRNLPYSTFLPTSSNSGPIQSSASNHIVISPPMESTQQLQNNRLSYIGPNINSANMAPTVNLPSPTINLSNGMNSTYGTLNNSVMINRNPNGTLPNERRQNGLITSYISSLNNATRPVSSSTPSSSSGNMICLPEEPELVRLGEDHEGLPPLRYPVPQITSSSEGHVTIKRPVIVTNENCAQNNLHTNKISPDIPSHFSSSPSPPTITASSASSAVSSLGSAVMKSKPPTDLDTYDGKIWMNRNNANNNRSLLSFSAKSTNIHPNDNTTNCNRNEINVLHPANSSSIPVYAKVVGRGNKLSSARDTVASPQASLNISGSSSIIGIGPGHSLQQSNNFGSLHRPNNNTSQQTPMNSNTQDSSAIALPLNPHFSRFNNLNQPNAMYQISSPPIPPVNDEQVAVNKSDSLNNSTSSQTPTPPPPIVTVQHLPASKATFSGMGTHV